jgi:PAS domain S-box-containing protein/putative nucleotidyltransferase with HDIG domain
MGKRHVHIESKMRDEPKTKGKPLKELHELRRRIVELEAVEAHRKEAEQALRESESKYRFLVENSKEIILILNKKGRIIFANRSTLARYGYSKEELIGKPISRFLTRDCAKRVLDALTQEYLGHPQPELEVRARTKSGEIRYLRSSQGSVPVYEKGTLVGVMVSARDVTEDKKAEEALRENRRLFEELWDDAPVAYHTLDTRALVTRVNQTEAKMLGYAKEEMVGKPIFEFVLPEQRAAAEMRFLQKISGQNVPREEVRIYVKKDGSRIYVDIDDVVERNSHGKVIGIRTTMVDITQRKRAEEETRNSEELFKILFEYAPDAYYLSDLKGKFIDGNKVAEEVIGYKKEELIGQSFLNLNMLSEDQIPKAVSLLAKNAMGRATGPLELVLERKDGSKVSLEIRTYPVKVKGRTVVLGIARDITQRKKAEELLRESEEKFRNLAEQSPNMIFIEANGRVLYANKKCEETMGYGREEIYSPEFDFLGMIAPEFGEKIRINLRRHMKGEEIMPYECPLLTGKGKRIEAVIATKLIDYGREKAILGTVTDITELKRAEDALLASEERYRNLFNNVPVGLYRTTPGGDWLDANAASARMLGYPDRESMLRANALNDYVSPEDRERWKAILETSGVLEDFEVQLRRQDGKIIWVKDSARAIKDKDGLVLCYEGAIVDFTERKKAGEELDDTLKMLRKSLGATIQAISRLVETRDPYTAGHQRRVADLARAIATEMRLPKEQIEVVRMAGLIHDIGKISIPAEILSRPGRLGKEESNLLKIHPQSGYEILKQVEFPGPVAQTILQHHERIDGSGYPLGLKDKEILIQAKTLAVADVVEAMLSHRPYRPARSLDQALEEISKNTGVLYDPKVVEACLSLFREKGFTFREEQNATISPN